MVPLELVRVIAGPRVGKVDYERRTLLSGSLVWLLGAKAEWKPQEDRLVVTIESEGDDPDLEGEGVLDEVRDCAIAAFDFSSGRIDFGVLKARTVKSTDPTDDALSDAPP